MMPYTAFAFCEWSDMSGQLARGKDNSLNSGHLFKSFQIYFTPWHIGKMAGANARAQQRLSRGHITKLSKGSQSIGTPWRAYQ